MPIISYPEQWQWPCHIRVIHVGLRGLDIGATSQEEAHRLIVALYGCQMQGSTTTLIPRFDNKSAL